MPAVALRMFADAARMAALAEEMRAVAARRDPVQPIVGNVVGVHIAAQPMPTTPPNAPLCYICTKSLGEGCPCEEMTLEAQEAWRNSTPTNAPLRCICTKLLSEGCPCLEMALKAQETWRN